MYELWSVIDLFALCFKDLVSLIFYLVATTITIQKYSCCSCGKHFLVMNTVLLSCVVFFLYFTSAMAEVSVFYEAPNQNHQLSELKVQNSLTLCSFGVSM